MQIISFPEVAIMETYKQEKVSYIDNDIRCRYGNYAWMKNRIRELRKARGMTQDELAAALGKTKSWISKLETGKAELTLYLMTVIAKEFQCHVSDLLEETPPIKKDERNLLENYRALHEPEKQEMFLHMLEAAARDGKKDNKK